MTTKRRVNRVMRLGAAAAIAMLAMASPGLADTKTWIGPNDGNFETGANWGGTVPADDLLTDIALINTGSMYARLSESRSINGLAFQNGSTTAWGVNSASASYVLSLGSGGITVSVGAYDSPTISANLFIATNQTWSVSPSNPNGWVYTTTVSGNLTGSSAVTITGNGNGQVYLSGTNSGFTGNIVVNNRSYLSLGPNGLGSNTTVIVTNASVGATGFNTLSLASSLVLSGRIHFGDVGGNNSDLAFSGATQLPGPTLMGIRTRTDGGSGSVTLGGNISGAGGINFVGAVTSGGSVKSLILSGTNNIYLGATSILGSTLQVAAAGRLGAGGPVTIYPGARLAAAAAGNFSGSQPVAVKADALQMGILSLSYDAALPMLGGTSGGILAIDINGNYSQNLAPTNDMFLGSTVATATLTGSSLSSGSGSVYRLGGGGGTLTLDYNTTSSTAGVLTGGNDLIVGRNGGGVNFAGSVTTRDNNALTGSITVNRDSTLKALLTDLAAGAVTPFGGNTGGAVTLSGGTLAIDKGTASAGARTVTKGALTYTGSSTVSLTGDGTRAVQLTVDTLARDATYGAGLIVSAASGLGSNEKFIVTTSPPARSASTAKYMVAPYMAASDGNFVDYNTPNGFAKSGFDYTWSSGDGSAIGTNDIVTYTANGPTAKNGTIMCKAFNMGGLNLQSGGASSKITITSGGVTATGGLDYLQPAVQFGPDGALVEGCVYVASGVNLQFFADVTGASLTKFGPGQLSMTTLTRSLSGLVTVAGGNFYVTWTGAGDGTPDRFPNISGYVVNGGTLEFWGHTLVPKNITVGPLGGTVQNLVTSSNFGISGNILAGSAQSGVLTLGGANTGNGLTISGANTYNGGTIVQGGGKFTVASGSSLGTGPVNLVSGTTLVLQGNANIATNAAVTVNGTASFQSAGPTIGSLAGSGSVVLGTASVTTTLTAGGDNTDTVFSGAISEAGAGKGRFTKTGTGALTLWGVNTYTGPTIVSNGALTVNGSLGAGAVTVAAGATLGGQGTVGGPVTVESGGILAPGDGPGTLTTGDLTLRDNAEIRCEIGASNALDKVVCGALTLGSRGTLRLYDVGTTRAPRGDFVLIQYTGSDPDLGDWSIDRGTTGWFTAKVRQNTDENQIILRFAMNPGTVVLIR